nr:hypothetical protein Iba_chr13eCG9540 [Ipomoea batatas]
MIELKPGQARFPTSGLAWGAINLQVFKGFKFSKVGETTPTGGVVSPSLLRSRGEKEKEQVLFRPTSYAPLGDLKIPLGNLKVIGEGSASKKGVQRDR